MDFVRFVVSGYTYDGLYFVHYFDDFDSAEAQRLSFLSDPDVCLASVFKDKFYY